MSEIKLTPEAQADIKEHTDAIGNISNQIMALEKQRAAIVKGVNYIWRSEYRQNILDDKLSADTPVPDLIDMRTGNIGINIEDGIASWKSTENSEE